MKIGYARVSTSGQDLTAQRDALIRLGVDPARVYVDHGLTGTTRARPGLREAMAACRAGDVLVVTKLDRLARSLPDARNILGELTDRGVALDLGGARHDPADPVGRLLFNVLAMVAEFESDLIRMRTREGLAVAKARGRLKGKQPKLTPRQEAHLVQLHAAGEHAPAELAELFGVGRSTVYRALDRARATITTATACSTTTAAEAAATRTSGRSALLEVVDWPAGHRPDCPACGRPTTGLAERAARTRSGQHAVTAVAQPCGCHVDEHAAALQAGAREVEPTPVT
jgi:DNA invertase Pin-like site-specific DNA recombinase